MVVGEPAPLARSGPGLALGRGPDVSEHQGGCHHVSDGTAAATFEELFDFVAERIRITDEKQMVVTRERSLSSNGRLRRAA
jgi:hypothetical protein